MNPCTEIRGDEKVRLRPDHDDDEDQEEEDGNNDNDEDDGEDYDGGDKSDGMVYPPVRLLLNAWLVP